MNTLIKMAKEDGNKRVILSGDINQFSGIGAGAPFKQFLDCNLSYSELTEHLRQKKEVVRNVVELASKTPPKSKLKGDFEKESVEALGENIIERKSRAARINKVVALYTETPLGDREDTGILVEKHKDRIAINNLIREKLKEEGTLGKEDHSLEILENTKNTKAELRLARYYSIGNTVVTSEGDRKQNVLANEQYEVIGIDYKNNLLSLKRGNTVIEVDPSKVGAIENYTARKIEISEGESLVWRKNHDGRLNKTRVNVEKIGGNGAFLRDEDGRSIRIDLRKKQYLDHATVETLFSSQGSKYKKVLLLGERLSKKDWYVGTSRAIEELIVVTDNKDKLVNRIKKDITKDNALEFKIFRRPEKNQEMAENKQDIEFKLFDRKPPQKGKAMGL